MPKAKCPPRELGFARIRPCDECPWRKDVAVGRFAPERFVALARTVARGAAHQVGQPVFACHKSHEGKDVVCAGFLLVDGGQNFTVRLALFQRRFDPAKLEATGPLYASYAEMAAANGVER